MKLSTRNQISGTVADVHVGEVMASVKVSLGSGETITAAITAEAVADLGLEPGKPVTVLVKATEVMLAKGSKSYDELTTRNQIRGKVTSVETGSVMAEVQIDIGLGELVAAVTKHSVERLGLSAGDDVVVLVKATEVMLAK